MHQKFESISSKGNHFRSKQTLTRLLSVILQFKEVSAIGLFMILLSTLAALLEPRVMGWIIDDALLPKDWNKLHQMGVCYVIVLVVRVLSLMIQSYCFELLGQRVTQDLREKLFGHIQRLSMRDLGHYSSGKLLTRVMNDTSSLQEMFSGGFLLILTHSLLVLGTLIWLFVLSPKLALLAVSILPALFFLSAIFSRSLKKAYHHTREHLSVLNSFLAENISGMKVVQLFSRQKKQLERFYQLNERYAEVQTSSVRVFAYFQPSITLATGFAISMVIGVGGRHVIEGILPIGILVTFFSYLLGLFQPIRELADRWNVFLSGLTAADRIFDLLDTPTERECDEAQDSMNQLQPVRGHIVFEDVSFSYDDKNWILQNFSLEILPGQRVGIVGHTGAGKSTLIQLLLRFYDPQKGRILLDGVDIRTLKKKDLRASLGFVQQDIFLFSGTLGENLTLGSETKLERLHQWCEALELGLELTKKVEERGVNLSAGEKQKIALVQVMLREPKIWILDEATAHLDAESERVFHQALEWSAKNCTQIMIAHRLETVRWADRIIVLNQGRIVELGTHSELMHQNGLYSKLIQLQYVSYSH